MNLDEVDWRYSWISSIYEALESGFVSIDERGRTEEWFDGLWQMEHAEGLYGIAFIAAQNYILGTTGDINRIRVRVGKPVLEKIKYYSDDLQYVSKGVSRIILVNSIANYYKHHEEWNSWPVNTTTKALGDVGIIDGVEFPCYKTAEILWDGKNIQELGNLLLIISEWRKYILSKYK